MSAIDELFAGLVAHRSQQHERPNRDEYGLLMAQAVALRADCTRRRVGAVVFSSDGRVVGTGYNGAPPGRPGCLTEGACPRGRLSYDDVPAGSSYVAGQGICHALHAEANALLYSDPLARRGGTMFVTDAPCDECSRLLAGSGLHRVVWPDDKFSPDLVPASRRLDRDPVGGLYG